MRIQGTPYRHILHRLTPSPSYQRPSIHPLLQIIFWPSIFETCYFSSLKSSLPFLGITNSKHCESSKQPYLYSYTNIIHNIELSISKTLRISSAIVPRCIAIKLPEHQIKRNNPRENTNSRPSNPSPITKNSKILDFESNPSVCSCHATVHAQRLSRTFATEFKDFPFPWKYIQLNNIQPHHQLNSGASKTCEKQ